MVVQAVGLVRVTPELTERAKKLSFCLWREGRGDWAKVLDELEAALAVSEQELEHLKLCALPSWQQTADASETENARWRGMRADLGRALPYVPSACGSELCHEPRCLAGKAAERCLETLRALSLSTPEDNK